MEITLLIISFVLMTVIALNMKYIKMGLAYSWAKFRYKENAGVLLLKNKNNNIGVPYFYDTAQEDIKIKIGSQILHFPIIRENEKQLSFLGLPLTIRDIEDAQNELGLVYQDPNDIKKIIPYKYPNFINSNEHQIILNNAKLQAFKDLFKDSQRNFMILVGIGIALLFILYVNWELLQIINSGAFI